MTDRKERIRKLFGDPNKDNQLQINRLRRRFVEYISSPEWELIKNKYSKLVERNKNTLGKNVSAEILRKFAKNEGYKNTGQDFNSSSEARQAIAEFLTSPDIDFLWLDEFENLEMKATQLPFRLSEFFGVDDVQLHRNYDGEYLGKTVNDDGAVIELSISSFKRVISNTHENELPAFQIAVQEYEDKNAKESRDADRSISKAPLRFQGWGAFAEKDVLIIILNAYGDIKTRIFTTAAIVEKYNTGKIKILRLLKQNDVSELIYNSEESLDFPKIEKIMKNCFYFQRVADFSSHK